MWMEVPAILQPNDITKQVIATECGLYLALGNVAVAFFPLCITKTSPNLSLENSAKASAFYIYEYSSVYILFHFLNKLFILIFYTVYSITPPQPHILRCMCRRE